jgi:hypothetical protein
MLGKPIEFNLWLAPNIYIDLNIYNTTMIASLTIYIAYLVITSLTPCKKTEQNK